LQREYSFELEEKPVHPTHYSLQVEIQERCDRMEKACTTVYEKECEVTYR